MRKRNYTLPLLIILLLTASAVRLFDIQTQSIWFDEGWSAYSAIQPSIQAAIDSDKTNPPLYYVIVNFAARGFGDSEFALRWVSLAFGLLAVALAYQLGKQLFNRRAGFMAALLMAFSPLLWWASQEARMYSLLAVLVLLCAIAWHKLIPAKSPAQPWRWWLILWLSELAILYTHNTGPVVVLWLNMITIVAWLTNAILARRTFKFSLRTVSLWFAGQIVVGLLWLPYFVNRFLRLSDANSAVTSTSPFSLDELSRLWQAVWTGTWAMVGHEPLLMAFSAVAFILTLILIPWRKANARWLVLHVLILTAGLWLALSILGNEVHGRYLVMIAPLLLVAIAAGFSKTDLLYSPGSRYPTPSPLLLVVIFLAIFSFAVHFATTNPAYQHDDARAMVSYYADHLTANDSALMWSYADRYELAYYWDRLGVKAKRITLPEGSDLDSVLPLLPKSGDVALNIWYTQRADYRGMMGCLLGDGTVNEPERFEVYGMTNLLFHAPTLHPPMLKPFDASLSMAKVTAIGEIAPAPADRAICVPIQITLTQTTHIDLKAAVTIENTLGSEIAHTDAIFADRVQRLSSQLPVGSTLTAYALLRLPYGAPAGDYTLHVRLYDEQAQPSGYNLILNGQTLPDLQLPLSRTSGADWDSVNRTTDLPIKSDLAVSSDLKLMAHNLSGGTYHNGGKLNLALLWSGNDKLPDLQLASADGKWQVAINAPDDVKRDMITLDWRQVQIPLEAASGTATIQLPDGTIIGSITIEAIPAIYDAPKVDTTTNIKVPTIGTLVGYSVTGDMTDRTQPFTLSLVWKPEKPTIISYTVFAQLISTDGQVLAQSDSLPANGTRPTTGWRTGEYILDEHTVTFHADAAPATANLIVGLYDAATSQRVPISTTSDFITLQTGMAVH
ncbi:MAG: glycosyltransferase family 39 protein [Chloroflexota bacterium]